MTVTSNTNEPPPLFARHHARWRYGLILALVVAATIAKIFKSERETVAGGGKESSPVRSSTRSVAGTRRSESMLISSEVLPPTPSSSPKHPTREEITAATATATSKSPVSNLTDGALRPRAFEFAQHIPCLEPENPKKHLIMLRAKQGGIYFQKPAKVGSSTAAGVTLRIARNVADRQAQVNSSITYPVCQNLNRHGAAKLKFYKINRPNVRLWSIVRDPTSRLISYFYHFWVGRQGKPATADSLRKMIERAPASDSNDHYVINHYIKDLSPYDFKVHKNVSANQQIQEIIDRYDFLGITERMDESLVALAMLWNLPLADVLYLPSKVSGGYDDGGFKGLCYRIPRAERTPEIQEFIQSPEFQAALGYDSVIYLLVNQSLDLTIDNTLGRSAFEENLRKFKHALAVAKEQCSAEVTLPCTGGGRNDGTPGLRHRIAFNDTDCLVGDAGCGYMCLDDVASELGLWEPLSELQYRHPHTFGMGKSTLERMAQRKIILG